MGKFFPQSESTAKKTHGKISLSSLFHSAETCTVYDLQLGESRVSKTVQAAEHFSSITLPLQ